MTRSTPQARAESGPIRQDFWWLLVIVAATFAVYSAVFSFEFVNYDDVHVNAVAPLADGLTWKGLRFALEANLIYGTHEAEYWQPVTSISRLIDISLFGLNPAGHHLQSLLLHILNACLVFLLVRRLGAAAMASGAVALVFALHPVNVEVVCWIAARKDLLCGLGSLLTLLAYVRFAQRPSLARYLVSLLAFAFALMSKPTAIFLAPALLLLDAWPLGRFGDFSDLRRDGNIRRILTVLAEKIPFGLMAVLVAGVTFVSQRELGGIGGSGGDAHSLVTRFGEAAIGYVTYLRMFFWPTRLCILYYADGSVPDSLVALGAVSFLLAITVLAIALRRRVPTVLFGWLFFLGLLLPLMGLFPFGRQTAADRYLYIPALGLIAAVVFGGVAAQQWVPAPRRTWTAGTAIVALGICLGWLTRVQSLTWKDSATMWTQALLVDPGSGVAHNNFAEPLQRSGDFRGAEFQLRMGAKCQPTSVEFRQSLGIFLLSRRRFSEAAKQMEKLVAFDPMNMKTHTLLVRALRGAGQEEAARRALARQEAIRGRMFVLVGSDYLEDGDWVAAEEQLKSAWTAADGIELAMHRRVELAPAANWAGRAEKALGSSLGSVADKRSSLRGLVYALQNRWPEAESAFAAVLQLNANDVDARWRRAVCLRRMGKLAEAEQEFAAAVQLNPKDADMAKAWAAAGGGQADPALVRP